MGVYLNYIIPIGAIGVGLAAGSGYGLASWLRGIKIIKRLLYVVAGLQVGTYFLAQYVEYRNLAPCYEDGTPLGALEYYDVVARSFAWNQTNGSAGEPLGLLGYFFRLLEVAGFTLGGLIVPAIMLAKPYCSRCQVYMKSRELCLIPASVPLRKIKAKHVEEKAAYEASFEQAMRKGQQILAQLTTLSANDQCADFMELVEQFRQQRKATNALPRRILVTLSCCTRCHDGFLAPTLLTHPGTDTVKSPLERITLKSWFVQKICQKTR
jgi:hypothetical protein